MEIETKWYTVEASPIARVEKVTTQTFTHLHVAPTFRIEGGWQAWLIAVVLVPAWYVGSLAHGIGRYWLNGNTPWKYEPCGAENCYLLVLSANGRTWFRLPNPWHRA